MEYKIIKINNSSILSLTGLAAQAKTEGFNFVQRTIEEWQTGENDFSKPGEFLLGFFDSGNCVAIGGLNIDPYANDPAVGRIRHLYVSLDYRRKGIAKILLAKIIEGSRKYFDTLRLAAYKPGASNDPASRLYESAGFIKNEALNQTHIFKPQTKLKNYMNILVIGSGGREHALAWKLKQSPRTENIFIAPGNAGTSLVGENVSLDVLNHEAVIEFARANDIGLVVVGPDDVLASGIVNSITKAGIKIFGPTKEAAQIEWSKSFAKDMMERLGIPTARSEKFTEIEKATDYIKDHPFPLVIKASGLALGKGVVIAANFSEAVLALEEMMVQKIFGAAGETVIIEEFLEGEEISVHAFCDGKNSVLFPAAQDHKRIFDGDRGPNTGGMGTVAPVPAVSAKLLEEIKENIISPALNELKNTGREFKGVMFPGIMLAKDGPRVLEFNARFGDPETQSYMRLLKTDLVEIMLACIEGELDRVNLEWDELSACCVVLASKGYPGPYPKGLPINGLAAAQKNSVVVFHAGTKTVDGQVVTNGGRVLGVSATGKDLAGALRQAYQAVAAIDFDGKQFRKDIA